MSAGIFGANLLEEVQEQSLNELLADLRYNFETGPACPTGIEKLDSLLNVFLPPRHESNEPSPDLNINTNHVDNNIHINVLRNNRTELPIIELGHSVFGVGRTSLLYHITAASILPHDHGGKEAAVVWLDTDNSFSASRLHQICINYMITQSNEINQPSTREDIALEALKHVHVFPISSSRQLFSTLTNLENYLFQTQHPTTTTTPHHSRHRPLSLIILDSATAFHWTDKWELELTKLETAGSTSTSTTQTNPPTPTQILRALKSLQTSFDSTIIYTTTTPTPTRTNNSRRHQQQAIPTNPDSPIPQEENALTIPISSPWTTAATVSLRLTRLPVPQFASHMGLAECLRDRAKRQEIVRLNRVRVGIFEDWFSSVVRHGERGAGIRDVLGRLDMRGAFVVSIRGEGVVIE